MSRVSKGFAMTAGVLGILAFLFGLAVAICSWVLSGKVKGFYLTTEDTYSYNTNVDITFKSYWWGGFFYLVPGILGIVAGCTRNTVAMIFYMIFNILCLLSSVLVSVFVAILIVAWAVIQTLSTEGQCNDSTVYYTKQCICYSGSTRYTIHNMSCSDVKSVQSVLAAIIALASISSLVAFIASYVSCCALCNQESETQGTVIIQPGAGNYQPPANVIVTNTSTNQYSQQPPQYPGYAQQPYAQPPQYAQQPPQQQYVQTYDKANLMKNEVI